MIETVPMSPVFTLLTVAVMCACAFIGGYRYGRRATYADLQRVSKSLAEGMSAGPAQATNDMSDIYANQIGNQQQAQPDVIYAREIQRATDARRIKEQQS